MRINRRNTVLAVLCVFVIVSALLHFHFLPKWSGAYNRSCYLSKTEEENLAYLLTNVIDACKVVNLTYWLDYGKKYTQKCLFHSHFAPIPNSRALDLQTPVLRYCRVSLASTCCLALIRVSNGRVWKGFWKSGRVWKGCWRVWKGCWRVWKGCGVFGRAETADFRIPTAKMMTPLGTLFVPLPQARTCRGWLPTNKRAWYIMPPNSYWAGDLHSKIRLSRSGDF